ncbi:catechol 2,3-dioxygenase [Gracilibacillus ureilyticus]|uniref:Catechol 2,3-dioxygenase n=1 Tax=Gracilibacillus ureilyticus TaxID=531814 RepID=A0A1H9QTL4_9BACI|nr:VOC family protein [Gracilibacillus ureilyticus]SER63794.1 catechol 2,3-dioxygenase [Gracilibacillus ureilyticus]
MNFHQKPNTFVSHVSLKVTDLNRSLQFYQHIVGFDILERTQNKVLLTADGKTSILSLEKPENVQPKQGRTTGLYHFAILLPTRKDLANFVFHTVNQGVQLGSSDHLVSEALYFNDPDGNGIEVYTDRDPAEWKWQGDHVVMAVDPLDFEDLVKEGHPEAWQGLPSDTVMGHIHLHVADLDQTHEFYIRGLGFDVVSRFGDQALFIATGNYHHHIGLNTWNGVGAPNPPEESVGIDHYVLTYPNETALHLVCENLKAIGAQVEKNENQIITIDPSGNRIILTL